jgi:hypothetical protein
MSRLHKNPGALLVAALLATGCSSTPNYGTGAANPDAGAAATVSSNDAQVAAREPAASNETGHVAPAAVIDVSRQPPAENTGLVCREVLLPNSNNIARECRTPAAWKRQAQAEAARAQATVLALQGGRYH